MRINGMHCGSCSALIEETLLETAGVGSATVDLASGLAEVTFDPSVISVDELAAVVAEVGYAAEPLG
jgi:Cu+-exporting ATPase